ncbi:MAG: HAD family hydrolase [Planctomycetes bacterium]|nr:HAD family hydrolase [Planctomycetota bacterium]
MQLVVFDVDGTLTRTHAVDHVCFLAALREDAGLVLDDVDWNGFTNVTNHGVVDELWQRLRGVSPTASELALVEGGFVARLAAEWERDPARFAPIAGAPRAFERARALGAVAIATGGWRKSACFKLARIGVEVATTPAGFSEDGPARETILARAIERARAAHGVERFDRIVSVGDATWDVRAAARMGLPFVGIGRGGRAEKLAAAGAELVLGDYDDLAAFERALVHARVPRSMSA